jgi:proteasome beta subunit
MTPQKIELPESDLPVTIIAALRCDDGLLLASDSEVSDGVLTWQQNKLDTLDDRPLAWGYSGAEDIGVEFGAWLRVQDWTAIHDWRAFRDAAANTFSQLNGEKRRIMNRAGTRPKAEDTADVLIAGYINDTPEFLEIDNKGRATFCRHLRFAAIGSGKSHAIIVYRTAVALSKDNLPHRPDTMKALMTVAADLAPQCRPPIRVLQITPDGTKDACSERNGLEYLRVVSRTEHIPRPTQGI